MFDQRVPPEIRTALIDRYEGYEIVELLQLSAEEVIDALEEIIVENLDRIREELGMEEEEEPNDGE